MILQQLYNRFRKNYPVSVNCWFCNSWQNVDYRLRNGFKCSHCDQYNGFKKDGSYNIILPSQYDNRMNPDRWSSSSSAANKSDAFAPKFCYKCSVFQELKIRQLADFVPEHETDFDSEIEAFRTQLESVYALCDRCERILDAELQSQKQKFASEHIARLVPSKQTIASRSLGPNQRFWQALFLAVSLLLIVDDISSYPSLQKSTASWLGNHLFAHLQYVRNLQLVTYSIGSLAILSLLDFGVGLFANRTKTNTLKLKSILQAVLWSALLTLESQKQIVPLISSFFKIIIILIIGLLVFVNKRKTITKNPLEKVAVPLVDAETSKEPETRAATTPKLSEPQLKLNRSVTKATTVVADVTAAAAAAASDSADAAKKPDDLTEKFCDLNLQNMRQQNTDLMSSRFAYLANSNFASFATFANGTATGRTNVFNYHFLNSLNRAPAQNAGLESLFAPNRAVFSNNSLPPAILFKSTASKLRARYCNSVS